MKITIGAVINSTADVGIKANKEEGSPVGMKSSKEPSVVYVSTNVR